MQELAKKTGIQVKILNLIIKTLQVYGANKAVIYGSRGRGDWSDPSDIDIAYWGDNVDEGDLSWAMRGLPTIHKIKIVDFDGLSNEKLKQNILRDGLLIYGCNKKS